MLEELDNYDWEYAFIEAQPPEVSFEDVDTSAFTREDVKEIIAYSDGENDCEDWIGIFELKDGRFVFVSSWCDYTGWDCQAGGGSFVSNSLEHLLEYSVSNEEKKRLEIQEDEEL